MSGHIKIPINGQTSFQFWTIKRLAPSQNDLSWTVRGNQVSWPSRTEQDSNCGLSWHWPENCAKVRKSGCQIFRTGIRQTAVNSRIALGYKVLFLTAQKLTSQLYASLADATFRRELERLGKYLNLDKTASNHFFQVINQAYERQSVIITSNRPFIDPFKNGLECSMMW